MKILTLRIISFSVFAYIIWVTICPLPSRPHIGDPQLERMSAYICLGILFAAAYPKQKTIVAISLVMGSIVLEFGQFFAPHRDPHLIDALAKAFGALLGVAMIYFCGKLFEKIS
ncbi:VanZ family protein [Kozakia baliensis]|uniref:hypothetical protein n=1 Tax=Kozakia baliensis TaxID=153496 RepID=UPI00068EDAF0|nr:hypothetical protein [Kozakia baliensis]